MPDTENNPYFHAKLTQHEWKGLEIAAARKGKKNVRRFITSEMHRIERELRDVVPFCGAPEKKRSNKYMVPEDLRPFYKNLALHYGTTVTAIIFRLVICPHLAANESRD